MIAFAWDTPLELPSQWLTVAPMLVVWLSAAAVKPAPVGDADAKTWETRLRILVALAASVAATAVDQTLVADDITLGGVAAGVAVTLFGSGAIYDRLARFVDVNRLIMPTRGIDPANRIPRRPAAPDPGLWGR
jgi:hypothetical protein